MRTPRRPIRGRDASGSVGTQLRGGLRRTTAVPWIEAARACPRRHQCDRAATRRSKRAGTGSQPLPQPPALRIVTRSRPVLCLPRPADHGPESVWRDAEGSVRAKPGGLYQASAGSTGMRMGLAGRPCARSIMRMGLVGRPCARSIMRTGLVGRPCAESIRHQTAFQLCKGPGLCRLVLPNGFRMPLSCAPGLTPAGRIAGPRRGYAASAPIKWRPGGVENRDLSNMERLRLRFHFFETHLRADGHSS